MSNNGENGRESTSGSGATHTPKSVLDRIAAFKFQSFVPNKDNWKYYLQQFEMELGLLQLNVPEYSHYCRDLLLRSVGSELFCAVAENFDPTPVSTITYEELTSFLTSHNTKPVSYIIARCEFGQCYRDASMSVAEFLAKLRSLAPDCQFGASLDERLRDQFLIGLRNPSMLERISELHRSPTDKLVDIVNSALNIEAAQNQRAVLEKNTFSGQSNANSSVSNLVNQIQISQANNNKRKNKKKADNNHSALNNSSAAQNKTRNDGQTNKQSFSAGLSKNSDNPTVLNPSEHCLRCAGKRHNQASDCRAKTATCRACNKVGHYDKACVSTGRAKVLKLVQCLTQQPEVSDYRHLYNVNTSTDYRHFYNINVSLPREYYIISPRVNGKILSMEYDTAADGTVIGSHTWKGMGSPKLCPTSKVCGYGNAPVDTLGEFNATVQIGDMTRIVPLTVSSKEGASLFGKDWMSEFNIGPLSSRTSQFLTHCRNNSSARVNNVTLDSDLKSILTEFKTLFSSDIGTVRKFYAKFELEPNAQPKIFKPRSVPIALKHQVAAELDRLVANDVIEPVNVMETPIEWASPIVIDTRKNGKIRICADFKVTINRYVKKQLHPLPTLNEIANKFAGFKEYSIL